MPKIKLARLLLQFVCLVCFLLFASSIACGQTAVAPSRTQCRQWDDALLSLFNWAVTGSALITLALSLMSGFLGRVSWIAAAPYKRIVAVIIGCLLTVTVGIPLGPWIFGLGRGWFGGVATPYFDCASVQFGATGLFGGLISPGIPALAQWPVMILAFCGTTGVGGLAAAFISGFINKRFTGVPAILGGENE